MRSCMAWECSNQMTTRKTRIDNKEIKSKDCCDCWGYPTVPGLLQYDKQGGQGRLEISQNLGMDHDDGEGFPFWLHQPLLFHRKMSKGYSKKRALMPARCQDLWLQRVRRASVNQRNAKHHRVGGQRFAYLHLAYAYILVRLHPTEKYQMVWFLQQNECLVSRCLDTVQFARREVVASSSVV